MKLHANEKTVQTFRKHWFIILIHLIRFVVMALIPFIIIGALTQSTNVLVPPIDSVLSVLGFAWVLFMWIGFFIVYTDYYLDVWVLTNQRLIDIEQQGLFWRDVATVRIEKIEDVRVTMSGFFPSLLGYGNVHIQSAGANKEFVIYFVNNPNHVRDMILREQERKSDEIRRVRVVE